MGGIFDRFPGSTNPRLVDVSGCDTIVEPFAGSMRCTVHYLGNVEGIKQAIVSDIDATVRAVIVAYQDAEIRRSAITNLNRFQKTFLANPEQSWDDIKQAFDYCLSHGETNVALVAAISILYRAIAHAGIVRCGKSSNKINVSAGRDQVASLHTKKWHIPALPPNCEIQLGVVWQQAIRLIPRDAKAIVLIDPPYWSPLGMEPCYPGHQPKSLATLELFHSCLAAALYHPGVHRVVAKNYCGQQNPITGEIKFWPDIQPIYNDNWHCQRVITGQLKTCGHGVKHGRRANKPDKPKNVEAFWTFQKEPFEVVKQLELV